MRCEEVREALPAYAGERSGDLGVRRHLADCPDCRAELTRYQELLRDLGALRSAVVEPPPGLARALAAIPHRVNRLEILRAHAARLDPVRAHVVRNRSSYAGGAALALVGATGALLWRRRVAAA